MSAHTSTKTISLTNTDTSQSRLLTIAVPLENHLLNLNFLVSMIPMWESKSISIFCAESGEYLDLKDLCHDKFMLPNKNAELDVLMIRFCECPEEVGEIQDLGKKERSRERTIKEIVELVHRWRELHDCPNEGKKINLQESAKIVGISKKSLDDYYYQLRMGEKYGFEFKENFDNKVGLLRSFVKEKEIENKNEAKSPALKHTKKLKIISEFAEKLTLRDTNSEEEPRQNIDNNFEESEFEESKDLQNECSLSDSSQLFLGSPFLSVGNKSFFDYENFFFNDLDNIADDPFIPFTSFKRTKGIEDIAGFLCESGTSL